jgi:hypothetical protein
VRRLPLLALACLLLAACSPAVQTVQDFEASHQPNCTYRGQAGTVLVVLMAQAVPTASQLPCIKLLPAGLTVSDVFVRNDRARFALDSDRDPGHHIVEVVLERTCRFGNVTQIPSDTPGVRRYQQVDELVPGRRYRGTLYHLFDGGCVTYRLDFRGAEQARPLSDVGLALGFVSREALRKTVHDYTDGRLQLDPPAASG